MLQNHCKTLRFKTIIVYKKSAGGGGGGGVVNHTCDHIVCKKATLFFSKKNRVVHIVVISHLLLIRRNVHHIWHFCVCVFLSAQSNAYHEKYLTQAERISVKENDLIGW